MRIGETADVDKAVIHSESGNEPKREPSKAAVEDLTHRTREIRQFLQEQGQRTPDQLTRGGLKADDLGWCNQCRDVKRLDEFPEEDNRLGHSYICEECSAPAIDPQWWPSANKSDPEAVARQFQDQWEALQVRGKKRVPIRLMDLKKGEFKGVVDYCPNCRRFHPSSS